MVLSNRRAMVFSFRATGLRGHGCGCTRQDKEAPLPRLTKAGFLSEEGAGR
jgi:hypothetical protein